MLKSKFLVAVMVLLAMAVSAMADERIGVGYAMVDDGNCAINAHTLTAEYDREGEDLEVRGRVRTEPSGGDCRKESISYDVFVARYFGVFGDSIDAFVEFGANEQSAAAPYALTDESGNVLLRSDGRALFSTNLSAGSSKTIIGAFGLSKDFGALRLGAGTNLVPVDWADHDSGRTLHFTAGLDVGDFDFDSSVDVGASHFGQVSTSYRHGLDGSRMDVGVGVSYYWGIGMIDNGAPAIQYITDSRFARVGAPRNDSLVVSITLGFSLR